MKNPKKLRSFLFIKIVSCLVIILVFASVAFSGEVTYIHDKLGRLVKVFSETGEVVVYFYDEVGNLIAIDTSTVKPVPPVVYSISPDVMFSDSTVSVTIKGENLAVANDVTSDNLGIEITDVFSADTTLTATFKISPTASLGQTNVKVKTPYGLANINISIYKLTLTPEKQNLEYEETTTVAVKLEPAASKEMTFAVVNKNPEILETTPASITFPANGDSASFTVKAIDGGKGIVEVGGVKVEITAKMPFKGSVAIPSQGVCVDMVNVFAKSLIYSGQVNVQVGPLTTGTLTSQPVSVINGFFDGGFTSQPVSVQLLQVSGAAVSSGDICVEISD